MWCNQSQGNCEGSGICDSVWVGDGGSSSPKDCYTVAGMGGRTVVTICGVIKARAIVKLLVTVYGLAMVALSLRRWIAVAGMEDRAVVTTFNVMKARATASCLRWRVSIMLLCSSLATPLIRKRG